MKKIRSIKILTAAALTLSALFNMTANAEDLLDKIADLSRFLIGKSTTSEFEADLNADGVCNVFDMITLRRNALKKESHTIYVTTADELSEALKNAIPGDEIVLKSGTYTPTETGSKGANFYASADGTAEKPITLRSENTDDPALLYGKNIQNGIVLYITGDYWNIENLDISNAQKGVILDNSNYSNIINCRISETGSEGIHLRDDSSYCKIEQCIVTNTGRISPGYGEAIYVGSSESTSGYGYSCDYNTISNCILGPGVTAEMTDIKEYTTGTIVENCTLYGDDLSGQTSANAFIKVKGNDCVIRNNVAYQNGNDILRNAFEVHEIVSGWGYNNNFIGNTCNLENDSAYVVRVYSGSATASDNIRMPEGKMYYGIN